MLLAVGMHGILILMARYRFSYDAYTHMLFAEHYRQNWWSLWDTSWYTGFTVVSYPPLVHQIIGLLGGVIGVDAGYAALSWAVLATYPIAVYSFSRVFVEQKAAEYAAFGAAFLPSIYLTAYTFGQLPTLSGTLAALFFTAALAEYLKTGKRLSAALAVALVAVTLGAHHATLLFLPGLVLATGLHVFVNRQVNWKILLARLVCVAPLVGMAGLLVIWPFWQWGLVQAIQTPIDHGSRHNFITDLFAGSFFFIYMYGPMLVLIPFAVWKMRDRRFLALSTVFAGLFILGLGGTTPVPRWIFGAGWEWLTYDRFSLWATLILLPFFGVLMNQSGEILEERRMRLFIPPQPSPEGGEGEKLFLGMTRFFHTIGVEKTRHPQTPVASRQHTNRHENGGNAASLNINIPFLGWAAAILGLMGGFSILVSFLPSILPTQPAPVDMQPIVQFLAQGNRSQWRYVTFGFGDQFAYLNRLTSATTIDGSYHTARTLPELRTSGLGQIDSAYWLPGGLERLGPILQKSGERGVRWGFVDLKKYIPILQRNGWGKLTTLSNAVEVWENPRAVVPPQVQPPVENPLAVFSWGVLPLLSLVTAGSLALVRFRSTLAQKVLLGVHRVSIGLLPVGLCFWYYRTLVVIEHAKVYFTYDHALFYISDGLALTAVLVWGIARAFSPDQAIRFSTQPTYLRIELWLLGVCLLATLSTLWSQDWRISLFTSLHLWLVFGLFLSVRERPDSWRALARGGVAALILQIVMGTWQFIAQSTAFLAPLRLNWPGNLQPASPGASVVQLADGMRWLRVYGSLPHPNILGGLVFIFLAGIIAFYLTNAKPDYRTVFLIGAGLVLLVLTFSRSAWLALAVFVLLLAIRYRGFERKRMLVLFIAGAMSLVLVSLPLWPLIFARSGSGSAHDEAFSLIGRTWLAQESWQFIQERPLKGVGAGAFIIELAQRAGTGYIVEPVHNVFLLVISELGAVGGVLAVGLAITILVLTVRARRKETIIFSAMVIGLGCITLFDHYLWSLAPGRMIFGLALGMLAGQVNLETGRPDG